MCFFLLFKWNTRNERITNRALSIILLGTKTGTQKVRILNSFELSFDNFKTMLMIW